MKTKWKLNFNFTKTYSGFSFHIYISFLRMHLCSAVWLLSQNHPWQKWVKRAKILFLKNYSKIFLLPKEKWNTFLRIVSGIIRLYNLHSWEFVIKALLNSSKCLRLWNLWPIIVLNCIPLKTTARFASCLLSIHP